MKKQPKDYADRDWQDKNKAGYRTLWDYYIMFAIGLILGLIL